MEEGEGKTHKGGYENGNDRKGGRGGGEEEVIVSKTKIWGGVGMMKGKVLWIKTQKVIVNTYITKNS